MWVFFFLIYMQIKYFFYITKNKQKMNRRDVSFFLL